MLQWGQKQAVHHLVEHSAWSVASNATAHTSLLSEISNSFCLVLVGYIIRLLWHPIAREERCQGLFTIADLRSCPSSCE